MAASLGAGTDSGGMGAPDPLAGPGMRGRWRSCGEAGCCRLRETAVHAVIAPGRWRLARLDPDQSVSNVRQRLRSVPCEWNSTRQTGCRCHCAGTPEGHARRTKPEDALVSPDSACWRRSQPVASADLQPRAGLVVAIGHSKGQAGGTFGCCIPRSFVVPVSL